VFDGFRVEPVDHPAPIRRAVVTVGGNGDFGYRRLVDGARAALDDLDGSVETLWQVGATDVSDLPIDAVASLPSSELGAALRQADVVIGHAGTGTALAALSAGKVPVLAPRSVEHGEHVDAHQRDLARFLGDRGLAVVCEADAIRPSTLDTARRWRAVQSEHLAPVPL
jgi:UDP-N-acetylglucosamine transferase subunit ALG13